MLKRSGERFKCENLTLQRSRVQPLSDYYHQLEQEEKIKTISINEMSCDHTGLTTSVLLQIVSESLWVIKGSII